MHGNAIVISQVFGVVNEGSIPIEAKKLIAFFQSFVIYYFKSKK